MGRKFAERVWRAAAASENNVLNRRWLEEFGGLLGLRVSDLIGMEGIEEKHLIPYTYPTDERTAARRGNGDIPRLLSALGRVLQCVDCAGVTVFRRLQTTVEGSSSITKTWTIIKPGFMITSNS